MSAQRFNSELAAFIDASPTPFHATANLATTLADAGYSRLDEAEQWQLSPRGKYYVTRNDSSLIAFQLGRKPVVEDGIRLIGAHTDSPCLKLKPQPIVEQHGYIKCGVEVYGGVLLNPWFDRDLSLAGRVTLRRSNGSLHSRLINLREPVAIIPSLAIHLDRDANNNRSINPQTMLPPIIGLSGRKGFNLHELLHKHLKSRKALAAGEEILEFELSFYSTEAVATVGVEQEFIAGARLDNLLSCYTGVSAMVKGPGDHARALVCNDHEEVGSGSSSGARGNFLKSVLERIAGDDQSFARMIARSMLISTDNAHGVHPNFADRHDAQHGPVLNRGPVIKLNSNQAYATNSESAALIRCAAKSAKVALQSFIVRTDMGCGSTIGPLTATALGIRTVDVGVPTFAMHSIRETAGVADAWGLARILAEFVRMPDLSVPLSS